MASILNNAQNTSITGGSFNITTNSTVIKVGQPLDVLFERVARNAISNEGGRADEVRCHPGTRENVIGLIEKWGDAEDDETPPMFWLSGPAGAGKSAIMQTIAERCDQRRMPHANFFFFRADSTRSNAFPLIATLVYQLISLYPPLRDIIATLLFIDPLVLDSALENQLFQLIVAPLRVIKSSPPDTRPLVLLIDGLDECDSTSKRDQQRILQAFDRVLAEPSCPFRVLIASRDESQIQSAFNKLTLKYTLLFLNHEYEPEDDIRLFVTAKFEEIKQTHPLAHTLDAIWPPIEDVNYIVEKSSGQLIYSATVMRFISESAASPLVSLERVKGAVQLGAKSPFSYLDAIYTYILSQADDQEALKDLLRAACSVEVAASTRQKILNTRHGADVPLFDLLELVDKRYTHAMSFSLVADITPIARYDHNAKKLLFYHATFPDYLLNPSRSKDYFIDMAQFHYMVLPAVWQRIHSIRSAGMDWLQFGLCGLVELQKLPPHLMSLVAMTKFGVETSDYGAGPSDIFKIIYDLCDSEDDFQHFRYFFKNWIKTRSGNVFKRIKGNSFCCMCYCMAMVDCLQPPSDEMLAALHPETDSERRELSVWLIYSVFSQHIKTRPRDTSGFKQLLKSWISWAIKNEIPSDVFKDFPGAQDCIRQSENESDS